MNTSSLLLDESELAAVARQCAFFTGLDADDLKQEFAVVLIERARQFDGVTKGYIKRALRWTASHLAEKERARTRLNRPLGMAAGEAGTEAELDVPDTQGLSPEEIYLRREARALEVTAIRAALVRLTPRQRAIAQGLMRGQWKMHLAARHGISKSMVTKEVGAIRRLIELGLR